MTPNASPHDETLRERGVYALPEEEQRDFGSIMRLVHEMAVDKGWWDGLDPTAMTQQEIAEKVTVKIALCHSELSEALEEVREGRYTLWYEGEKPEGFGIEMADAVIRIMDLCRWLGVDLLGSIRLKSAYNDTRAHRHGGKAI